MVLTLSSEEVYNREYNHLILSKMESKICFKCGLIKTIDSFYKHHQLVGGRLNKCKECTKSDVRKNLAEKKEYYSKYEKDRQRNNFVRIFQHRFSGIKSRVLGKSKRDYKVKGSKMFTKEQFTSWCYKKKNFDKFIKLHGEWKDGGFERRLCPSIDRINENGFYTIGNIQWIQQWKNTSKYRKLNK